MDSKQTKKDATPKVTYNTSLSMNEKDWWVKEELRLQGHSIIDIWRAGAKLLKGKPKKKKP